MLGAKQKSMFYSKIVQNCFLFPPKKLRLLLSYFNVVPKAESSTARVVQSETGTPVLIQRISQHSTCGVPYLV